MDREGGKTKITDPNSSRICIKLGNLVITKFSCFLFLFSCPVNPEIKFIFVLTWCTSFPVYSVSSFQRSSHSPCFCHVGTMLGQCWDKLGQLHLFLDDHCDSNSQLVSHKEVYVRLCSSSSDPTGSQRMTFGPRLSQVFFNCHPPV